MKAFLQISVFNELGNSLNSREAVYVLSSIIQDKQFNPIELDFEGVEFMSRSFADQFHKEKIKWQEELHLQIDIVNANENVIEMLKVVAQTQDKKVRNVVEVPVFKFTNAELIFNYMLSI